MFDKLSSNSFFWQLCKKKLYLRFILFLDLNCFANTIFIQQNKNNFDNVDDRKEIPIGQREQL